MADLKLTGWLVNGNKFPTFKEACMDAIKNPNNFMCSEENGTHVRGK